MAVRQRLGIVQGLITKKGSVLFVGRSLQSINTVKPNAVPENAQVHFVGIASVRSVGRAPVYNMEVADLHNYAVNDGIILHNCDALRYFCNSLPAWRYE